MLFAVSVKTTKIDFNARRCASKLQAKRNVFFWCDIMKVINLIIFVFFLFEIHKLRGFIAVGIFFQKRSFTSVDLIHKLRFFGQFDFVHENVETFSVFAILLHIKRPFRSISLYNLKRPVLGRINEQFG